jgi:hypothetical protein
MKDEKIVSAFGGDAKAYALKIYAYFECFKCHEPYFGGMKDCMREIESDSNQFNPH